jgi:hypothetical protein
VSEPNAANAANTAGPAGPASPADLAAEPLGTRPFRRADYRLAILLAVAAFLLYNLNFRAISSGDCLPARFLPFAVLEEGSLHLDPVLEATRQGHTPTISYWVVDSRDGRHASMYPIVAPLLATPVYVPAWIYMKYRGWTQVRLAWLGELAEKAAASLEAALTCALMFLVLRRRLSQRNALILAAIFAFATETWVISSQALWQHGTGELLGAVVLLAITVEPSWRNVLVAGFATGLMAANRPPDAVLAAGFSLYALFWARKKVPVFALVAAVPVALTVVYNVWMIGNVFGGYGLVGATNTSFFFAGSMPLGVAGLLLSPGKGLFVYAPFLLFLPLLFRRSLADRRYLVLTLCLAAAVIGQLLLYARTEWRGGYSWGPRYMTDMLPLLFWLLAPIFGSLRLGSRRLFLAAAVFATAVQVIGAFFYPQGESDVLMHIGPGDPRLLPWRVEHSPIWVELKAGPAPMPFLRDFGIGRQPGG